MSKYASKSFWVDTFDRAVSTFAQALIGTNIIESAGLLNVDWVEILSVSGAAALTSVLTSVAFRGRGEEVPEYDPTAQIHDTVNDEELEALRD